MKPLRNPVGCALGVAVLLVGLALAKCAVGCATPTTFTPAGAAGVDAAFAVLCPLESLASPALGGACPGEEAAFDAVVASRTAPAAPAPAPSCIATSSPTTSSSAPLVPLLRRGGPGEPPLVHVGSVPPGPTARALQVAALALPPGPVARKPLPASVLPILDAGRDAP